MTNRPGITLLVAPLDWGLGHATRCIPLISHFLQSGCKVIIAAEGIQKKLLETEFPMVQFVLIRGYRIRYSKVKRFFAFKIFLQIPRIIITILYEKKWLNTFLRNNKIDAVISDNRYGLYHSKIVSVFITHQLRIKTPFLLAEKIIKKINYRCISKFSFCWVPDEKGNINCAGKLSHPRKLPVTKVQYIGGISRLEKQPETEKKYDILIILSGPEPQRTLLEEKLLQQLYFFNGKALLVRGLPASFALQTSQDNLIIKNHLPAKELEKAISESEYIISRSGYTTVMDICKLQKKAVLIPTPGQTEQEYLAAHLQRQKWCVTAAQENFSLEKSLQKARNFTYEIPELNMEKYKEVLDNFIKSL